MPTILALTQEKLLLAVGSGDGLVLGTCESVAEFEPGSICGRAAKERGQGFAPEVIWQACECPEPDGGAGECDDLVADEDGGGMVERAIDTFETERLRAKDSDNSLQ